SPGVALHWDGSAWTPFPTNGNYDFIDVWAASSDQVFALSERLYFWDGSTWTPVDTGALPVGWGHIGGNSACDFWIAPDRAPHAFHFDGSTWQDVSVPGLPKPQCKGCSAADGVWSIRGDG